MFRSWFPQFAKPQSRNNVESPRRLKYRPRVESLERRLVLTAPVIDSIANVDVPAGKMLILPLTASDLDGDTLSYTITSNNGIVNPVLHTGNTYLKLTVANFGTMTFQLFNDLAPNTVETITGFVNAGFYDGLIFHRVVKDFVIQGGDPQGTGSGGPGFQFDDEFNAEALFTGDGQLAMANSGDDTNGSQFFVTLGDERHLDFNHTIFGQLVRGFSVMRAINSVPVNASSKPLSNVTITKASIVQNKTDAVVTLKPTAGTGQSTITVQVSDGTGNVETRTFKATVVADTKNEPAFLLPIENRTMTQDSVISFNVNAFDLENDALTFTVTQPANGVVSVAGNTITVTPGNGFTGALTFKIKVKDPTNAEDSQSITIGVGDEPITGTAVSIDGVKGQNIANAIVARFTDADVNGQAGHFTAQINWGDGKPLTTGTVEADVPNGGFIVRGSHTYTNEGNFPVKVTITGNKGALAVVKSTAAIGISVAFSQAASSASEGAGEISFIVSLGSASDHLISVDYAVTGGTATAKSDYILKAGTLIFNPGQSSKTITIAVIDDFIDEPDQTVQITLSNAVDVAIGTNGVHTFTIQDNDAAPFVSFAATRSSRPESFGLVNLVVRLLAESQQVITVAYNVNVAGGSAISGDDFTFLAGTLTFNPGETSKLVPITILDDVFDELTERVQVKLANATNATIDLGTHTMTIVDNDPAPKVQFETISAHGDESTAPVINVILSQASGRTVTVRYRVDGGTAKGGGNDYSLPAGTLTFNPGETMKQIPLSINPDGVDELDETLSLKLFGQSGATLGSIKKHTYVIDGNLADEGMVSFAPATGNSSEAGGTVLLTLQLAAATTKPVTVYFHVTGGSATSGQDFKLADGFVTFNPGQTTRTISLKVIDDHVNEADETVEVSLLHAANAVLGIDQFFTLTINDND